MRHLQSAQPRIELIRSGERLPVYLSHRLLWLRLRLHTDCLSTNQSSSTTETGVVCVAIFSGEIQERSEYCVSRMRNHAV
jgi:hypothetical protein